jgi:twinkle protein
MLVVTEGEVDCLSVAMANGDGKWPVVSLPSGAQSAKSIFKAQFPWLDQFETVTKMSRDVKHQRKLVIYCQQVRQR